MADVHPGFGSLRVWGYCVTTWFTVRQPIAMNCKFKKYIDLYLTILVSLSWEEKGSTAGVCWAVQWSWFARVNALCNLSLKKSREVASSLPADFCVGVVSHCLQQWKLNLELRKCTNATTVAVAKTTGERGWRVEKKCLCIGFWLTRRSRVREK